MPTYRDVIDQLSPYLYYDCNTFAGNTLNSVIPVSTNDKINRDDNIDVSQVQSNIATNPIGDKALQFNGDSMAFASSVRAKTAFGRSISLMYTLTNAITSTSRYSILSANDTNSFNLFTKQSGGGFKVWFTTYYNSSSASNTVFNVGDNLHIVLVLELNHDLNLYVNGVLEVTKVNASNGTIKNLHSLGSTINTKIDGLCIHDKTLNQTEITKLYTASLVENTTINGTISESLLADDFKVMAHRFDNGDLSATTTTNTSSFSLIVPDIPHYVVVLASQGERWLSEHGYIVGDKVYPNDIVTTPFYYECTTAGTSGLADPAWQTGVGTTTNDNGIIWQMVEHLIQPVAHSPVIQ